MKKLLGVIAGALLLGVGCAHSSESRAQTAGKGRAQTAKVDSAGSYAGTGGGGLSCEVIGTRDSGAARSNSTDQSLSQQGNVTSQDTGIGGSSSQSSTSEDTRIGSSSSQSGTSQDTGIGGSSTQGSTSDDSGISSPAPQSGASNDASVDQSASQPSDKFEDTGMGGAGGGGG
ncbi:hypothetical protein [Hyalangium versicolor]|uniref:hypothetical protein n=1 Tax=Hyalangium versicolor TaxID=2861190 RepID=UPI001CC99F07|nr:hypothetical protein [Hyalangium versicolor]